VPQESIARRPVVSAVEEGPEGRQFTVTFQPGQRLPSHRNASRVVITAVEGNGEITVEGEGSLALPRGAFLQLEPNVEHSVVAGEAGLELVVRLVRNCCEHC
jgi:quercetin dioxygenase-like cupin family protein